MTATLPEQSGPANAYQPLIVALHCSGGTGGQWRRLAEWLGPSYGLYAPNLHGAPGGPAWAGERPFRLADEAEPVLSAIDRHEGPVHLVGHSYGGGLALHVAAMRPRQITSLHVYEPSAFHLLRHFGIDGERAYREIATTFAKMFAKFAAGAWREAAICFIDYWNGAGAWDMMPTELQAELLRYLPKAALDFHALVEEATPLSRYLQFEFPVQIMLGEHAPFPTRLIAEQLALRLPTATRHAVAGAGHMGPLTHADAVAYGIVRHMRDNVADAPDRARAA